MPSRALALLLLVWTCCGAAAAGLAPCRLPGVEHEARCGSVDRPLDPARPDGQRIEVAFAVLPALARHEKPDPVFVLAGGPGQSAIDLAGPLAGRMSRLLNQRDVVLIDQRGTGRSAPLECGNDDPTRPLAQSLDTQRQIVDLDRCRERLQKLPWGDLRMFTTSIAMADVDAVRAALGAEKINLVGASYGTRAALEYMRQFPQHVRRVVLDGVVPPDMALPASIAVDAGAAFDALASACAADPACRAITPDLAAAWSRALATLPAEVAIDHPVTGRREQVLLTPTMARSLLRAALYVPVLASALPWAVHEAAAGRWEPLVGLASSLAGPGAGLELAQGMHFSVVCSEDLRHGLPPADGVGRLYREVCADWPRGSVPAGFDRIPPAPAPVLLLSGGLDPATPPRHGARVAEALGPLARHVVVPHGGHGVLALGCMEGVLLRFIDAETDAAAIAVDADCAAGIPRPPAFRPVTPP